MSEESFRINRVCQVRYWDVEFQWPSPTPDLPFQRQEIRGRCFYAVTEK